jgi:WD40 repeat protein
MALKAHAAAVNAVSISNDGTLVVTAGMDSMAKVWSVPDGRLHCRISEGIAISTAQAIGDGTLVAVAGFEKASLWSVPPVALAIAPSGRNPPRKGVRPPPAAPGRLVAKLPGHTRTVSALTVTADGKLMATGSQDDAVRLWSLPDGAALSTLEGHGNGVQALRFSPDGHLLVSSTSFDDLRVWEVGEARLLAILKGHRARVLAFDADGRTLATGSADNRVRLWSLPNGRLLATFEGHEAQVVCLAFSADGTILLSGADDRSIRVWSVPEKRLLATLDGHKGPLTGLAFVLDNRRFLSCSRDGSVRLWSLDAPYLQATLDGHAAPVQDLAVATGGRWAVSGDQNGVAIVWDLSKPALHAYLFDPTATPRTTKGLSYDVYDEVTGRYITYTLPCGSPIPSGAVCTCNCVPGSFSTPRAAPWRPSGGGIICTCNKVCTCVPVPSSQRWKTKIRPLTRALEQIERLRGVRFEWTAAAPAGLVGPDLGLIAEEVATVIPEAVAFDDNGAAIGVDYNRLTALLVEAVKSQQEQIADLRRELQGLHPHQSDQERTP